MTQLSFLSIWVEKHHSQAKPKVDVEVNSVCFNAHTGAALVEHCPAAPAAPKKRKAEEVGKIQPEHGGNIAINYKSNLFKSMLTNAYYCHIGWVWGVEWEIWHSLL